MTRNRSICAAATEIAITTTSLANILNSYVLVRKDAPLKSISIAIQDSVLKVKGKLHDEGDVPFETDGILSPTPDGKIRLQAEKIKTLHLPVKGLMELLGVDIGGLIRTGKGKACRQKRTICFSIRHSASPG